jgi:hypothetical protein
VSKRQDSERFKDLGTSLSALAAPPSPEEQPEPKPKPRQQRNKTIHFRASLDEHNRLQQAADRMGLTVSSFVRLAVREKLGLV